MTEVAFTAFQRKQRNVVSENLSRTIFLFVSDISRMFPEFSPPMIFIFIVCILCSSMFNLYFYAEVSRGTQL